MSLADRAAGCDAQVAIHGEKIYTMSGAPIEDGMIVIRDGKIAAIGKADGIQVPEGFEVLQAKVVTPGLIDAHCTVGLSGILNVDHDQDQLEHSAPIQPELRALDAYNAHEELVELGSQFRCHHDSHRACAGRTDLGPDAGRQDGRQYGRSGQADRDPRGRRHAIRLVLASRATSRPARAAR